MNEETTKLLDYAGLEYYNSCIQDQISGLSNTIEDKQEKIQFYEMPEVGYDIGYEYEGKIVQYIGEPDQNYTKGYFYECVGDYTQGTPTFSWVQVDVAGIGTALSQSY